MQKNGISLLPRKSFGKMGGKRRLDPVVGWCYGTISAESMNIPPILFIPRSNKYAYLQPFTPVSRSLRHQNHTNLQNIGAAAVPE